MPDPLRAVMELLEATPRQSASIIALQVPEAEDVLAILEREGLVVCEDGLWRVKD